MIPERGRDARIPGSYFLDSKLIFNLLHGWFMASLKAAVFADH